MERYNFDYKSTERKEKKGILFIDKIHLNCSQQNNENFLQIRLKENPELQQFNYANIVVKDIKFENTQCSVKNKLAYIHEKELQQEIKIATLSSTVESLNNQIESLTLENKILMDAFQSEIKRIHTKIEELEKIHLKVQELEKNMSQNSLDIITWDEQIITLDDLVDDHMNSVDPVDPVDPTDDEPAVDEDSVDDDLIVDDLMSD
ncbi:hypothetical protein HDU81_011391 [Chytriomyces hyalinus]|nr:hypothetical protein HDU81_011391 [Chytriomyces hyalinus]